MHLTLEEVRGLFALAAIRVLNVKPLVDGYGYGPSDSRYFLQPPTGVWWFVKTPHGWVEIGWRKRVIHISWEDTSIRKTITADDVTKGDDHVHAWTVEKALEYLKNLKEAMTHETPVCHQVVQ